MTDSDKNSNSTSQKNKEQRWEAQRTQTEGFSGDLRTKSKQKWNKILSIPASITQITQITDKLMYLICRYGK